MAVLAAQSKKTKKPLLLLPKLLYLQMTASKPDQPTTNKRVSFLSDCNLSLLLLLQCQSPMDFGLFDPVTEQMNGKKKIFAHMRNHEEEKEEWLR